MTEGNYGEVGTMDGIDFLIEFLNDYYKAKLKNIHVSAYEEDGNLVFLHKIKEGSVDKSYGIHVAKLAELPTTLINRANEILNLYETKEKNTPRIVQETLPLEFVTEEESKVEKRLKEIDPLNMTPMEALTTLFELKELEKKK